MRDRLFWLREELCSARQYLTTGDKASCHVRIEDAIASVGQMVQDWTEPEEIRLLIPLTCVTENDDGD